MAPGGNLGGNSGGLLPSNSPLNPSPAYPNGIQVVSSPGLTFIPGPAQISPLVGVYAYDQNTLGLRGNSPGITIGQFGVRFAAQKIAWGPDFNNEYVAIYAGNGAPVMAAADGSYYFRGDTPGTVNQRIYVHTGGAWVGIL